MEIKPRIGSITIDRYEAVNVHIGFKGQNLMHPIEFRSGWLFCDDTSSRIPFPKSAQTQSPPILPQVCLGLIDAEVPSPQKQHRVFSAVASHLLALEDSQLQNLKPLGPWGLGRGLPEPLLAAPVPADGLDP